MIKTPGNQMNEPKHLFTFVMEFAGGNYVAQARAENVTDACNAWLQGLRTETEIPAKFTSEIEALLQQVLEDPPIPLTGLSNVWCLVLVVGKRTALVNIVQTAAVQ